MKRFGPEDLLPLFPPRPRDSHKGTWGYLALFGGSLRYSGAPRLAALAAGAMRAGAGVVRLCVPRFLCPLIIPQVLEPTLFPLSDRDGSFVFKEDEFAEALRGTKAAAFGMGIGHTEETERAVRWLIAHYDRPLVLDADGLNALAALGPDLLKQSAGPVVLTPHLGEFSRLTGLSAEDIRAGREAAAQRFAAEHGCVLLLKGPDTVVTDGSVTYLTDTGCPGMGTAGSGDVLSGVLAALAAVHPGNLPAAAAAAAWINGRAGEIAAARVGEVSMVASDTAAAIPEALSLLKR